MIKFPSQIRTAKVENSLSSTKIDFPDIVRKTFRVKLPKSWTSFISIKTRRESINSKLTREKIVCRNFRELFSSIFLGTLLSTLICFKKLSDSFQITDDTIWELAGKKCHWGSYLEKSKINIFSNDINKNKNKTFCRLLGQTIVGQESQDNWTHRFNFHKENVSGYFVTGAVATGLMPEKVLLAQPWQLFYQT